MVADVLKSDLLSFAKHRNASYLVEKALTYCAPQERAGEGGWEVFPGSHSPLQKGGS